MHTKCPDWRNGIGNHCFNDSYLHTAWDVKSLTGAFRYLWAESETKRRHNALDQHKVIEGPIRLPGPLPIIVDLVWLDMWWGKMISHHSSLYWGWVDCGLWSWFLCSLPGNGERQRAVMVLQTAPAAHTQITEVIIYNQRDPKKSIDTSVLCTVGDFTSFQSGFVSGIFLLDFDSIIGGSDNANASIWR